MVNKLIKTSTSLMFQRQTTILSAAGVLMVMAIGGALVGLIKLHFSTGLLNTATADALDAYQLSFLIPDFIFNILIIGALNAAFIPVFGQMVHKQQVTESWKTLSSMINGVMLLFGLLAIVTLLVADHVLPFVAPGFTSEQLAIAGRLTKLLMISPILLGVSAFATGAIQVHHRFFIPALAPILYNLGAIFGILVLYPRYGVDGLAYGILIGSVLHLLIQLPMLYMLGYRYQFFMDWASSSVRKITFLTIPRSVGLGVDRLEVLVTSMLLTTLSGGGLYLFTRVQTLITFPISFFGVSIAQAALPTLTKEAVQNIDEFRQTLLVTFHQILYLVVPVTVLMVVLKLPVIRIVGNLDEWVLTLEAAQVLMWLAPAILAQSAIHLWARASYALEDTVAPLLSGSIGVIVTVAISFLLLEPYGMRGVALGMVVGGVLNAGLLIHFVHRRIRGFTFGNFVLPIIRIAMSGLIMAIAVYLPVKPMEAALFDTSRTSDLIMLSILVTGFGSSLYLFISWILGSDEITMFIKMAHRLRSMRSAFLKVPAVYTDAEIGNRE